MVIFVSFSSLLKVHLQLRGFTVFLDVEKLEAGKFDNNLLDSIGKAKCFLLVCSPNALDRCIDDDEHKDWVHRVRFFTYCHLKIIICTKIEISSL